MSPDYELAQELKRLGSDSGRGGRWSLAIP